MQHKPNSVLKAAAILLMQSDTPKNATKTKQCFESSSYSADAKRHRKTRFDDVNVALLVWFKKTRMDVVRWPQVRNVCFWVCKIYLYMSMRNKTENKPNLSGINLNVILKRNLTEPLI
jgi:hypothetical protein